MTASIGEFLLDREQIDTAEQKTFNGFNGLHGGLAVAMLVRQMRRLIPDGPELVSVTARFLRPLDWPIVLEAGVVRNGKTVTSARATASSNSGTSVEAHATFSGTPASNTPTFAPEMPTDLVNCSKVSVFASPIEFVPIAQRMEIRPATGALPYSGSADPVLCGWVRLRDDVPTNDERIVILVDSLAPSYTAVLTDFKAVPTVEMSTQLSAGAADSTFDWVLVRATTTSADERGFVRETTDIWTEGGRHLASCTQLRMVR